MDVVDAYVFLADLLEEIRDHGEGGAPASYAPGDLTAGLRDVERALRGRMTPEEARAALDRIS